LAEESRLKEEDSHWLLLPPCTTMIVPSEYLKTMTHEKIDEANAILKKLWQESHQVSEENKEG
jgi:hypothetical protein